MIWQRTAGVLALVGSSVVAADGAPAMDRAVTDLVIAGAAAGEADRSNQKWEPGCSARNPRYGVITFIRHKHGPVLMVAISETPLKNIRRDFMENRQMQDWGLVFDRNGDGRIDQLVYHIGPLPMEPASSVQNLPSLAGGDVRLTREQMHLMLDNMKLGFWQALDSNGDGAADYFAFPAKRNANGWYRGWAVTSVQGKTCRIVDRNGGEVEECTASADGRELQSATFAAHRWAADPDLVLDAFNGAARECRLSAADFLR